MNELISVIINVYNCEKYIDKCLKSIICQTYPNLEIIIVNDGSTDNTLQICESYKDERIKIINQTNMGLSKSRNVGIDNAKGEYLYFVDADDFVEVDVIEYLYKLIKKYNVFIATCRPMDIYNYNFEIKNEDEKIDIISNKDMLKKILLSVDRAGTIWNKLIKKEIFNEIRFENRIINDVVVVYKIALTVDSIAYSNQIKYFYLRHSNSITGLDKDDRMMDFYKASVERYNYIKNIYPDFMENTLCMIDIITDIYIRRGKSFEGFLKDEGAFKLYNKIFTVRILFYKMKFSNKIKFLLFRIKPKLCKAIFKRYSVIWKWGRF